jgi:hypothetical protein
VTASELPKSADLKPRKNLALANLRGYATLMVVSFHSLIAYMYSQPAAPLPFDAPPYDWLTNPIIDSARWLGFDLFCAFQYSYLMHLMFFLSGLFVWPSLVGKRPRAFLYGRLVRLGVPWVLGVYLLMPVAYYPVYLTTAADPSWSAFWTHLLALPFWPSGPLWFLGVLWAFNLIAALLYWLAPQSGLFLARLAAGSRDRPVRYFLGLFGLSAIAYVPLAQFFKPWQWVDLGPFAFQPSFILPYAVFFFAGAGVGALGLEKGLVASNGMLARHWAGWLVATPIAFATWLGPTALIERGHLGDVPGLPIVADLGLALTAATSSFAMLALFSRFATAPSPTLGRLSDSAYGIYLVHYVPVIWLQYMLLQVALLPFLKAAIVLFGSLGLSWAATNLWLAGIRGRGQPNLALRQGALSGTTSARERRPP